MLTLDGLYGSKYFEPLKIIGSNILGLVKNVINTNNGVFSNVSAEINATVVELSKTFGIAPIISSKKTSSGYTERGIMRNNEVKSSGLTKDDNTVKIIGDENLSTVTKNSETTNTTVRGLLHAILGVVKPESITKGANSMNMITATAPPAIHQTVETGGFIASGRATYYHPGDGGDPWGDMTSTGERYSYKEFTAAALPGLINKLPPELTVPVKGKDRHYKQSRTVQKPFMVRVVHPKTGKQAYIRINNVGQGGRDNRVIDFSSAPAKYFGGDVSEVRVYLAPQNATPGIINAPKYSSGGEYKFNSAPHKRWGGKRIRRKHAGEDFDMRDDGTFQSWIGGTVMYKGFQPGRNLYGHYIDVYNENLKVVERIAEAGKFKVQVGDKITPGQIVSTGTSTGMIHYEIRPMDRYERKYGFGGTVDPVKYLSSIGAANIAGNMIKNNSLASLVNGTVIANDVKQSPTNSQTSNTDQSSVVPVMSGAALANAFTQITQMLGIEPTEPPPKTENGLSLLFDGTKNNVVNIAHSMVNQNLYSNTRLRML
jgi:rare lipoprotein A (peptidoglycan hydrolase)